MQPRRVTTQPRIPATDFKHLRSLIAQEIEVHGPKADLNHIDPAQVKDLTSLFENSPFDGDISCWDVRFVRDASRMFKNSAFNGDLSQWKFLLLTTANGMFEKSVFNGDLSQWRFPNLVSCDDMFAHSRFNGDISQWNMLEVKHLRHMFHRAAFSGDLSSWGFVNFPQYGALVDTSFEGTLPLFEEHCELKGRTQEFETLLGGGDQLQEYLLRRPFGHAHAAFVMEVPLKPVWWPNEEWEWLRSFERTGRDFGMSSRDISRGMVTHFAQRKDHEGVSLEGLELI